MAVKDTTLRLHQDIKKDFDKMGNVREFGVKKYSTDYILATLANKYYKSAKTIENIVFNRVSYNSVNSSQCTLFK